MTIERAKLEAAAKMLLSRPWLSDSDKQRVLDLRDAAARQAAPEGYVLVPRQPTHAMCVAGDPDRFAPGDSEAIWEAMIEAAFGLTL